MSDNLRATDSDVSLSRNYSLLISFVFAAVVGQSLEKYSYILFYPRFSPSFLSLIGLYLLLLFSWAGYHQSLSEYPYTSDRLSVVRLGADFLIVAIYAYLLNAIESISAGGTVENYILGFCLVFVAYIISGYLRRFEYGSEASKIKWHVIMSISYGALYVLYRSAIEIYTDLPEILNTGVIILVVLLMLAWRYRRDIGGIINTNTEERRL